MGAVRSEVRITDGMSKVLRSMNKALNLVLNSFEEMQNVSSTAINTANIEQARAELQNAAAAAYNLEDGLDSAGDKLNRGTKEADALTSALKKAASVAAAIGIGKLVSDAIEYASDLQEVQNVVDVTFGKKSAINEWAQQTLDAVGLNELSAKKYAGTMGAMLKSSGITGAAVESMSATLTELAGDMASFYNLSGEEAFTKIRSGISGEIEPLKQLGINMSVANMEAYALSQGIDASYDSMTQAEQIMLRYNYLLSATKDAQGDFNRTQDSYANQLKLVQENWKQLTGELAQHALPILAELLQFLNNIMGSLEEYAPALETVAWGIVIITAAIAGYKTGVYLATNAQVLFNAALNACPLILIITLITGVIAALAAWAQKVGSLELAWMILCDAIMTKTEWLGNSVLEILQEMVNGAIDIINDFIKALNYIPGVSMDLVEHVTFADSAILASEAAQQARQAEIAERRIELGLNDAANGLTDGLEIFTDTGYIDGIMEEIAMNTGDISSDTGAISDALEITEEDLKYLRDAAEQEAVNRFTTAEIRIEMQNNNNISSDMDIDGIVSSLEDRLYESMTIAAEGAY